MHKTKLVMIMIGVLFIAYITTFNYGGCGVNDAIVGSSSNNNTLSVTTNPATNITQTSALLNGTVNTNGVITNTLYFNYGLTPSYTITTASQTIGGCASAEVWDTISRLSPNTLYYFRCVATNYIGTTYGNNLTFTTTN
jgi:hypothetical protein